MKKEHILIPEPNSKFLKVNCKECEKENIVYSHASTSVTCKSCGNVISEPSGSKARIIGKISGTAEYFVISFCIQIKSNSLIVKNNIIFFN